ncbi:MAG TPA: Fe-S cluster assembly protein SufD [Acidimicrobiales bacterium]|nr:Fe-S cluster assembly protein SufD [Acidimicrobiales bacterium]
MPELSHYTADAVATLEGPDWIDQLRRAAWERFAAGELPTEAEEVWRYSRIDDLDLDRYPPVGPAGAGRTEPEGLVVESVPQPAAVVLVVNGVVAGVDDTGARAAGATIGSAATLGVAEGAIGRVAGDAGDPLVELATAFMADACVIDVAAGAEVAGPIVVVNLVDAEDRACFPRTVVRLGQGARATVVEHLVSGPGPALCAPVVELDIADAASLDFMSVQQLGAQTWQLGYQASRVARDAVLRSLSVALGGDYARTRTDSHLVGQGGSSRLLALYFGDGTQMHDFRTLQEHAAPNTTSDLVFKGAVKDESRGVYSGLIRVRKGAVKTNAFQTNRNLVLSPSAHADSVPNLEIEDNDVRCSHASAVGPIDEDQRYYLESRGVPPEVAERLIVLGFFDDLLGQAPVPALRGPLRRAVAVKLLGDGA